MFYLFCTTYFVCSVLVIVDWKNVWMTGKMFGKVIITYLTDLQIMNLNLCDTGGGLTICRLCHWSYILKYPEC